MKDFLKNNLKTIIPYVIVVILGIALYFYYNKASNLKADLGSEIKLRTALLDTVATYKNAKNELVTEKLTLQADIKTLSKMNSQLTKSQQDLLARVKEIEKNSTIIAAALIETNVKLDSLRAGKVTVDTTKNIVSVKDSILDAKGKLEVKYDFEFKNVRPYPVGAIPVSKINELTLPNTQFVEFHWKDNKKEGYPISFSVSNSNKYFKTANIDSYAIKELEKPYVKPTFWQKVGKGLDESKKYAIGGAVGIGIVLLIQLL